MNTPDWKIEAQDKAEELTKQLIQLTNAYGSEDSVTEGILRAITTEHNTLQQSFWRAMQGVIAGYSEHKYVDLRNQASVDMCKAMNEALNGQYLPFV